MCQKTEILNIIYHIYTILWIGIPIFYLIAFMLYHSRKKVYIKAVKYTLIMCILLYIPKFIGYFVPKSCYNCALNNVCEIKKESDSDFVNSSKTKEPQSTTTSTTTKVPEPTTVIPSAQVIGKTSKGYDIVKVDDAFYINGLLIVNKTYGLPSTFVPRNTHKSAEGYTGVCNDCIDNDAYEAWTLMKADAAAVGLNLWIQSGYRPYVLQEKLYNNYAKRDGYAEADRYSARPGFSEHQTGICFDINNPSRTFNGTTEAKWINDNAHKYGFIIRYPKGKEDITGYMYESWHVRYVGKDLASELYNNGEWITLEEYLGIDSKYQS